MRKIGTVLSALLLVILMASCTQYIVAFPWGDQKPVHITENDVAGSFDQDQFNRDIASALKDREAVPGLSVDVSETAPEGYVSNREAVTYKTIYITVSFETYQNTNSFVINSGKVVLEVQGSVTDTTTVSLSRYKLTTLETMQVETTIRNTTVTKAMELLIPTATIAGTFPCDDGGTINVNASVSVEINGPEANTGATITVGNTEIPVDQISGGIAEGFGGLFNGGYGTEANPYEIRTTKQFLNLGNQSVQEMFLKGENDDLYFELTGDIDLRGESGYIAEVFSGTLIGNNHTIHGSNDVDFIFHYSLEDTVYSDFNIEFDTENITLLVNMHAFVGAGDKEEYDKNALHLTFYDIDYNADNGNDHNYIVGDNNFALYAYGNLTSGASYYDGKFEDAWIDATKFNGEIIDNFVTIEDCDVNANFVGGFGASGAAVFVGGQYNNTTLTVQNCTYTGMFTGYNVAMLVANSAYCLPSTSYPNAGDNATISNVSGGTIYSYSGNGSLVFSNSSATKEDFTGIDGVYTEAVPGQIIELSKGADGELVTTPIGSLPQVEKYQLKINLPTYYWYNSTAYNPNDLDQTNSNTFTIEVDSLDQLSGVHNACAITRTEAEHLAKKDPEVYGDLGKIAWESAGSSTAGQKYAYVKVGADWCLVIDYNNPLILYSANGLPTNLNRYSKDSGCIIVAFESDNEICGTSQFYKWN